jgi:hypothetical protein
MTAEQPVLLVELERDLGAPPLGWAAELDGRGVVVVADDLGRAAIDRSTARAIYAEAREQQEAAARKRQLIEQRLIAADEARRRAIPRGVPVDPLLLGVTPAELLMAADPDLPGRRRSVAQDALERGGSVIYSLDEGAS